MYRCRLSADCGFVGISSYARDMHEQVCADVNFMIQYSSSLPDFSVVYPSLFRFKQCDDILGRLLLSSKKFESGSEDICESKSDCSLSSVESSGKYGGVDLKKIVVCNFCHAYSICNGVGVLKAAVFHHKCRHFLFCFFCQLLFCNKLDFDMHVCVVLKK